MSENGSLSELKKYISLWMWTPLMVGGSAEVTSQATV